MSRVFPLVRICGRARLVHLLLSLWYSPVVLSAEVAPQLPPATSFSNLLQVLFGLGLVLGAIAGTAWLLKRLNPGRVAASGALRVVGGVAVGPKERVVLVDVGDARLILGVAPGHITMLHQMPRPDEDASQTAEPIAGQFYDRLKELMQKKMVDHAKE